MNMGKVVQKKEITEADFFSGIFAVLALRNHTELFDNRALQTGLAKIFQEFSKYAKQSGVEMRFRIRLHPFHSDSAVIHHGILSAEQRGIIRFNGLRNIIIICLTKEMAEEMLNSIDQGKLFSDFAERIIYILSY